MEDFYGFFAMNIKNADDYERVKKLGDWLADEVGDDMEHVLFHVFEDVMDAMATWEDENINFGGGE